MIKQNKQFYTLLQKYEQAFWRVAITYEVNPALREELFQEIIFEIWKSLEGFENRSSKKTYIYRVAHNVAFRHVNKQTRIRSHRTNNLEKKTSVSLEIDYQNKQEIDLLASAIQKLPIHQREIISLALEGLTYPEISEIVGISESNVGVILNRSKKRIREIMEKNNGK